MSSAIPHEPASAEESSDVASLFSRLGAFSGTAQYRELVRQEAAGRAGQRWPLLAELQGMPAAATDPAE